MKTFAIRLGKDLLEILFILSIGVLAFPYVIKALEWFASLYGYHL